MLRKLIAGSVYRKTRLHDEKGNFIGFRKLLAHGPSAVATGILRLLFGYRFAKPWIAYDSINIIKRHLNKASRVLEFGSGMSTIWYSKYAGYVCSIDNFRPWFDAVSIKINRLKIDNIKYRFAKDKESYISFMHDDEHGFDLIMIDGSYRSDCLAQACNKLKPGGILYLDNSDMDSSGQGGDMRLAEKYALNFAKEKKATVRYITDFAPTQLFVQQGLMIQLPV